MGLLLVDFSKGGQHAFHRGTALTISFEFAFPVIFSCRLRSGQRGLEKSMPSEMV